MSNSSAINKINVNTWIEENKTQFLPPVCNKLMYRNLSND